MTNIPCGGIQINNLLVIRLLVKLLGPYCRNLQHISKAKNQPKYMKKFTKNLAAKKNCKCVNNTGHF